MSMVAGIDFSSNAIDIVLIPEDGNASPIWHRFTLDGNDAFDRTRRVGEVMPGRLSSFWDDIYGVGIEHPAGSHGVASMMRVQGAVLSMIPVGVMVKPWPPAAWKKAVGLKGNATKEAVGEEARRLLFLAAYRGPDFMEYTQWEQDALDAFCIALATRQAIHVGAAA